MRPANSLTGKRIYEFGSFRLDALERVIESSGRPLSISPKALDLLIVLVENRGHIVGKETLMQMVWPGTFVEDNNLAFNVSVLRKLLGDSGSAPRYIQTVPKRGYRFTAEVLEIPEHQPSGTNSSPGNPEPRLDISGEPVLSSVPILLHSRQTLAPRIIRSRVLLIVLFVSSAFAMLAYFLHRAPILTEQDTIVLAEFQNRTGDTVFDGTLATGLGIEFAQSSFLRLASDDRIQRSVRLMGQPPDTRLTPGLARAVCERIGGAAVLNGSIASLGNQYVLALRALNCRTGEVLDEEQTQAAGKEDVLNALSRIARKFRIRVGESLAMVEKHSTPLPEASTPSLEALKAYSTALKVLSSTGSAAALPLFQRAAEIDPGFAMALGWIGRMYGDLGEATLSAQSTAKAWKLRGRVSDREKFWIDSAYETQVTGNLEQAQRTNELWAQAYPQDGAPDDALSGMVSPVLGKYQQAVEEARKAILLEPDFPISYYILAVNYIALDRLEEAETALQRASELGLENPNFLLARYQIAFLRRDSAGMDRVETQARMKSGVVDVIVGQEAFVRAYSGHLDQAFAMSRQAVDLARLAARKESAAQYEAGAAVLAALFGNAPEAARRSTAALQLSRGRDVEYGAALAYALAGNSPASDAIANDLERDYPADTAVRYSYVPTIRALLALNRNAPENAILLLQDAVPYELGQPPSSYFAFFGSCYPVYVRGQAFLAAHKGAEAAAEFQKIIGHPGIVIADPIGALAHLQLGRSYFMAGDRMKAKAAYDAFLSVWKGADPGILAYKQARMEYARLL